MRNCLIGLSALFLLNCQGKSQPESSDALSIPESITPAQADSVFSYLTPFPEQTQVAIAIIQDTSTVFWGVVRENDTLLTVENRQAAFEIGSITKVFTSALLSQLVLEGKVNLDDPIQQYLSFPLNPKEANASRITLKQLANHTAGLPRLPGNFNNTVTDQSNPYKNYGPHELEAYLHDGLRLQSTPGEQYAYSNLGAGLLGYILSQVAEQPYTALLQKRIFTPLHMQNSAAGIEELSANLKFITNSLVISGRDPSGNPTSNWELNAMQAAGAILSTTEDLSRFVRANFQENAAYDLQKEITFEVSDELALGLGWHIRRDASENWYWHNGGTGGYRSCLVLDERSRQGVIVLSNVSAFHPSSQNIDKLCFSLMQSFKPQ
ncbi:MAG: serine hydrolase domain-containing protein [Cyclobacteriaceae bacterium]